MDPKSFLEQECLNVRRSLDDTLRYEYGFGLSRAFYEEIDRRLKSLKKFLSGVSATDIVQLNELQIELSSLSTIVSQIERSHVGEFSWPFAEAFRVLATSLCRDNSPSPALQLDDPIFFMSSDGGLGAYRIRPEQDPVSFVSMQRKIFTIVFPRTLKHHILLHTILGHEVGHAAWTSPSVQRALVDEVLDPLTRSGVLKDETTFRAWLIKHHSWPSTADVSFIRNMRFFWLQEIMCDLIGLLLFGPSFSSAHRTLLGVMDPQGESPGPRHPPNQSRFDLIEKAHDHLGWKKALKFTRPEIKRAWQDFWTAISASPTPLQPYTSLFSASQVADAVDGLSKVLNDCDDVGYKLPKKNAVENIIDCLQCGVPPVSASLTSGGQVSLGSMDFRDIVLGGWIVWYGRRRLWSGNNDVDFLTINRLCNMAILQQGAVDIWQKEPHA